MFVPLTDQQHFSTCWPRVCTVPLEMSICTFACMITQNKKIKTIPSVQQWDLLGMKYIDACASKAMNGAETIDQFCLWESKRKDFFFLPKRKDKMDITLPWKPQLKSWIFHHEADFFCTSMMVQLLQELSDMLQPVWQKYSTSGTASF